MPANGTDVYTVGPVVSTVTIAEARYSIGK